MNTVQPGSFPFGGCVCPRSGSDSDAASSSSSNDASAPGSGDGSGASDGDDSESDPEVGSPIKTVDLNLMRLQSLHATSDIDCSKASKYAQSGYSRERIKAVLSKDVCECGCKIPSKLLQSLCQTFWSLPKPAQDALLWSLQVETKASSKRNWSVGGLTLDEHSTIQLRNHF